jgi:hypothetical protein
VESGVHAGFVEILESLNQPEVMDTITTLVKAQATVGVSAAFHEGKIPFSSASSLWSMKGFCYKGVRPGTALPNLCLVV